MRDSLHEMDPAAPGRSDVVISGVSCRLPESENLTEFWQNLETSVDMVTKDGRRSQYGLPPRIGTLKDLSRFDAEFFHINPPQATAMDPQLRKLLEVTYEAIVDSGYAPRELRGANACVYVGSMFAESLDASGSLGYGLMGGCDTMFANYLSFCFDFKGPSMSINTGCSASLSALDLAVKDIRSGRCDYAIVAGTNVITRPSTSLHFHKLKMTSDDGTCRAFDQSASGYVRSEGVVSLFLTTREKSRRSYLRILNCRSACDGHKPEGLTYPSSQAQKELILSTCREINLDPASVYYVEAHGTGTQAGDFEECRALDEAICSTPGHSLFIGSVKSNMGHCEPTSGLAGIVKVILSFQHGVIPANIHFETANPKISGITEGRLKVVSEPLPIPPGAIVGVNSFGFGGAISHVILQGEVDLEIEEKIDPSTTLFFPVSSRTLEGIQRLMTEVESHIDDSDTLKMLRALNEASHPHRGYLLWKDSEILERSNLESVQPDLDYSHERPVWFVFDGMGSQWLGMGQQLLQYPLFTDTIKRCYKALPSTVHNIITDPGTSSETRDKDFYPELDQVAALSATTIGLCDLLKATGVTPDKVIGHSFGELLLCYIDGSLTLKQVMQTAYWRVKCMNEIPGLQDGAMASVGLTWEEAGGRCPEGVWPACYNALDNVTITGDKKSVESFVVKLAQEGIFAKMVSSFGHANHSPLMKPLVCDRLLAILRTIIPDPKPQTEKWIVSSLFREEGNIDRVDSSPVFHVNSLVSPVNFYHSLQQIPANAIVIEVGPHALLQVILKRTLGPSVTIIPLQNWKESDQSVVFMRALASCHMAGLTVDPLALVGGASRLPVSVTTPTISQLMSWQHLDEWFVAKPEDFARNSLSLEAVDGIHSGTTLPLLTPVIEMGAGGISLGQKDKILSLNLRNYRLYETMTVPPSFYLALVWSTFAECHGSTIAKLPVVFKDVVFHNVIQLFDSDHTPAVLEGFISAITGHFEVAWRHGRSVKLVSSGQIAALTSEINSLQSNDASAPEMSLSGEDLYEEFAVKNFKLKKEFQLLSEADLQISECKVKLDHPLPKHVACYTELEAVFQLSCLDSDQLTLPKTISRLEMDPTKMELPNKEMYASFRHVDGCYYAKGLSMCDITLEEVLPPNRSNFQPLIEHYSFEPYFQSIMEDRDCSHTHLNSLLDIVRENTFRISVSILQVITEINPDQDAKLISQIYEISSACSWVEFIHDVLTIGHHHQTHLNVTGKVYHMESPAHAIPSDLPLYDLLIVSDTTASSPVLSVASPDLLHTLREGGFVMLREIIPAEEGSFENASMDVSEELERCNMHCVAQRHCISQSSGAIIVTQLYHHSEQMAIESDTNFQFVLVRNDHLRWIKQLKSILKSDYAPQRIYCICDCDSANGPSGLLGMGNCLKLEPRDSFSTDLVRLCYLFDQEWSEEFRESVAWKQIVKADLYVNVIRDEDFGSYRHFPLEPASSYFSKVPPSDESTASAAKNAPAQSDNFHLTSGSLASMYKPSASSSEVEQFTCSPDQAYIITGGLGGCGLELSGWLVSRGARQLYLTSRSGVRSGYQARKIEVMKKNGAEVIVSNLDVSQYPQALSLIDTALQGSPRGIAAVFHLAAVLRDALFRNQTPRRFESVLRPKSTGALNIDKALRKLSCDASTLFVAFSSVSSGFGIVGQTSYGFANSVMDRICEERSKDGLHGLSVQWGAIGGVGMVNKLGTEVETVAGTRVQPIASCLASMDELLALSYPVVSCYVPYTKHCDEVDQATSMVVATPPPAAAVGDDNAVPREDYFKAKLCKILSVHSAEKLRAQSTLSQLGLDSLMGFELRQLLESEYSICISTNDLPKMKVQELVNKISQEIAQANSETQGIADQSTSTSLEAAFIARLCDILSLRNSRRLQLNPSLAQLGLDSLMSFELRQLLESDFSVVIATSDLPRMKVQELIKAVASKAMEPPPLNVPTTTAGAADEDNAVTRQASDVSVSTVSTVNSQSDLVTVQGRSDE